MSNCRAGAPVAAAVLAVAALAAASRHEARQAGPAREFEVSARRFEFEPATITVDKGDRVKITVKSTDGTHGFAIKRLGVRKTIPRGGEPVVIEFEAKEAGNFEVTCSEYCGRGHRDMKGMLVVRP